MRLRAVVLALSVAARAHAEESSDAAAAETLFREGKNLFEQGEVAAACDKLERSHSLGPAIGTLGLLAACHEKQGRTATAWTEWLEVAAQARDAGQSDREKLARERATALEPNLSKLSVSVPAGVRGLSVMRSGKPISSAQFSVATAVDPGTYTIEARAPGFAPWQEEVTVGEGATEVVEIPALRRVATGTSKRSPEAGASVRADPGAGASGPPVVAWALVGVGVAGIAVGTVFGLGAISKNDESASECEKNACTAKGVGLRDDALGSATISTVGFVVGALGVGAGTWLLLSSPSDKPDSARIELSPTFGGAIVRGTL